MNVYTCIVLLAFRCESALVQRAHHAHMRGAAGDMPRQNESKNEYLSYFNSKPGDDGPDPPACSPIQSATGNSSEPRRTVVIAKYDEDVSWLKCLPQNIDAVVYQSKDPSAPHFIENVGNEASKYLSYIVENYDALPDNVMFIQAGRQDWHDTLPKDALLQKWVWGNADDHGGMMFVPTNAPCLVEDSVELSYHADVEKEPIVEKSFEDRECVAVKEHSPLQMATLRQVWDSVFSEALGPRPQRWITHCCAQFEVTREAIQQHPKSFYESVLSWTMNHDRELLASDYGKQMRRNHDAQRRDAGHVLEVTWALMFSNPMSRVVLPDV